MASATPATSSTRETTNYARLCRVLVDVGTCALRDTFNAICTPPTLHTVLAIKQPMLQSLKSRRIINATQWGKLFPAIPTSVSSRDFDITLLMILLRNLCGLAPPATGWDALPAAGDVSREADIARIKYYRNTVYAHAEHASVDDATFHKLWNEIRDPLVRLGGVTYKDAIDNLQAACMDADVENHYRDLLYHWKTDADNMKCVLRGIDGKLDLVVSMVTSTKKTSDEGGSHVVSDEKLQMTDAESIPAMEESVKRELDKMVKIGAMAPVPEPTKWVSQMVSAKKKYGSIGICIDPKDPNKALKDPTIR